MCVPGGRGGCQRTRHLPTAPAPLPPLPAPGLGTGVSVACSVGVGGLQQQLQRRQRQQRQQVGVGSIWKPHPPTHLVLATEEAEFSDLPSPSRQAWGRQGLPTSGRQLEDGVVGLRGGWQPLRPDTVVDTLFPHLDLVPTWHLARTQCGATGVGRGKQGQQATCGCLYHGMWGASYRAGAQLVPPTRVSLLVPAGGGWQLSVCLAAAWVDEPIVVPSSGIASWRRQQRRHCQRHCRRRRL